MILVYDTIWNIWLEDGISLSNWAVRYCCMVKDDKYVRQYIQLNIDAFEYFKMYGNKDSRLTVLKDL